MCLIQASDIDALKNSTRCCKKGREFWQTWENQREKERGKRWDFGLDQEVRSWSETQGDDRKGSVVLKSFWIAFPNIA